MYSLSNDVAITKKGLFFEKLSKEIMKVGNNREIIILGDLNSRTGRMGNSDIIEPFVEETTNDNGERLIDLCEQNQFKINNGHFKHKDIHVDTTYQELKIN